MLLASVLGSGMALLDGTVVNIALPQIGRRLDASFGQLQWVTNGYLLTLAALILVGGSLGDRFGRTRVFALGIAWFALASVACALAPNPGVLIAARLVQGIGGALLTPGSLAMIQGLIRAEDRALTIGRWAGLGGLAAVIGPLLGGWLLRVADWRWIFWINVPVAVVIVAICVAALPDSRDQERSPRFDITGAALGFVALSGLTYGLIRIGPDWLVLISGVVGLLAGAVFVVWEHHLRERALVPMQLFSSTVFSATNAMTLLVYGALGVLTLFLALELQIVMGLSPLLAGLGLAPIALVMLVFSPRVAALGDWLGPRVMMSVGPILAAFGPALLTRVERGSSYWTGVLPGLLLFSLGLVLLVAPLTATVLAAAPDRLAGVASGINNAVARTGSLLAVAALPALVGLSGDDYDRPRTFAPGFTRVMLVSAVLLGLGGVVSWLGLRQHDRGAQA